MVWLGGPKLRGTWRRRTRRRAQETKQGAATAIHDRSTIATSRSDSDRRHIRNRVPSGQHQRQSSARTRHFRARQRASRARCPQSINSVSGQRAANSAVRFPGPQPRSANAASMIDDKMRQARPPLQCARCRRRDRLWDPRSRQILLRSGISIRKQVPVSSVDSSITSPPCAWARSRAMAVESPVPAERAPDAARLEQFLPHDGRHAGAVVTNADIDQIGVTLAQPSLPPIRIRYSAALRSRLRRRRKNIRDRHRPPGYGNDGVVEHKTGFARLAASHPSPTSSISGASASRSRRSGCSSSAAETHGARMASATA